MTSDVALPGIQIPPADPNFLAEFCACKSPKEALQVVERFDLSVTDVGRNLYEATVPPELLGACLGHHAPFWKELALEYAMHWKEFAGLDICTAIRRYTFSFRLPSEAAPIERVMEGFARGFFAAQENNIQPIADATRSITLTERPTTCDLASSGWYVRQPMSSGKVCCASCGNTDQKELESCWGCRLIHFCPKCRRHSGSMGHSIRGKLGYGRACVAARHAAGTLSQMSDGTTGISFYDFSIGREVAQFTPVFPACVSLAPLCLALPSSSRLVHSGSLTARVAHGSRQCQRLRLAA